MKKVIVSFVIGTIFGLLIFGFYCAFVTSSGIVDFNKKYGMPEIVYYLLQPFSVLGTFLAVIVAIFGTEIKNMFFSPKCNVFISGDGFDEDLGQTGTSSSPTAQFYSRAIITPSSISSYLNSRPTSILIYKYFYFLLKAFINLEKSSVTLLIFSSSTTS